MTTTPLFTASEFDLLFEGLYALYQDVLNDTFAMSTKERKEKMKAIKQLEAKLNKI